MAINSLNSVRICLRNDTAANWSTLDPSLTVLLKGEIGIEVDTNKFKIGDGVHTWNSLDYASAKPAVTALADPITSTTNYDIGTLWINTNTQKIFILVQITNGSAVWKRIATADELAELGYGDMLKSVYTVNADAQRKTGYVDKALLADTLKTETGSASIGNTANNIPILDGNGKLDNSIIPTIPHTNVSGLGNAATKDTGNNVGNIPIVNSDGKLSGSIIPTIPHTSVSGLGDVVTKDVGTNEGNVPILGSNGKLNISTIPTIPNTNVSGLGTASIKNVGTNEGEIPVLDNSGKFDNSVIPNIPYTNVSGLGDVVTKDVGTDVGDVVEVGQNGKIDNSVIPIIPHTNISGLGNVVTRNTGTSVGNVVIIGSDGMIDENIIPKIAITDIFNADSEAEMLALSTAQKGDVCIRTDESKTYMLSSDDVNAYSVLANWKQLKTPASAVSSVNGKVGVVILSTDDVNEGSSNLYFTETRFNSVFSNSSSTGLLDTNNIMRYSDELILNCGDASRGQIVYTVSITTQSAILDSSNMENTLTLEATSTKENDSILWSIEDNEYIDIDSYTGVVSFKHDAEVNENENVVVTASSVYNPYVKDTITVNITVG